MRSDCAIAQADLNLRWAHLSYGTFSDVATHIISLVTVPKCQKEYYMYVPIIIVSYSWSILLGYWVCAFTSAIIRSILPVDIRDALNLVLFFQTWLAVNTRMVFVLMKKPKNTQRRL